MLISLHVSIKHPPIRENLCITTKMQQYSVKQLYRRLISFMWNILWRRWGLIWEYIQPGLLNITLQHMVFSAKQWIQIQIRHDNHRAFDIQPTKVVYIVPIDMNRKKILNITLDKNRSNGAETVKLVTDLEAKQVGCFSSD